MICLGINLNDKLCAQTIPGVCGVASDNIENNKEKEDKEKKEKSNSNPDLTESTYNCATFGSIKTIRIHVHYILRSNGTGNFNENNDGYVGTPDHNPGVTGYTRARTVIDMANFVNSHNYQLWLPIGNNNPILAKRLYFDLASVNFIRNDALYNYYLNNSLCNMISTDQTYGKERGKSINVYFLGDSHPANSGCASNIPNSATSFLAIVNKDWKGYYDNDPLWNGAGHLLCHEVGHCIGLNHDFVNDGCDDTPIHNLCWEYNPNIGCDWSNVSNNTMAWIGGYQSSLSPCQIQKIHNNLSTFLSPYISCDPITFPTSFNLEVSPNPNNGFFDITFESAKNQKIKYLIDDKQGNIALPIKSINTNAIEKVTEKISSNFSPDVYILVAQGEDGSYAYKQISIN